MTPIVDQFQETFRETESLVRTTTVNGHRKLSLSNRVGLHVRMDHRSVRNLKGLQKFEFYGPRHD